MKTIIALAALWFATAASLAQLSVTVSPVKITGQKAIVPLTLKNGFAEKIESARAVIFLMDEQGQMVGQKTDWVIGGTKERPALASSKETTYNFVITAIRPLASTNLTTKVTISRLILDGGKNGDVNKDVQIQNAYPAQPEK